MWLKTHREVAELEKENAAQADEITALSDDVNTLKGENSEQAVEIEELKRKVEAAELQEIELSEALDKAEGKSKPKKRVGNAWDGRTLGNGSSASPT